MAGEDLLTYSGQAAIAYQDALNQAKNTQNALLRQYGFVAPTGTGSYSVEAAQAAFDPNTLFDKATGGINQTKLAQLASTLTSGGGGIIGQTLSAGTSAEAEAAMQERGRFTEGVSGGISAQRRQLAEAQARRQVSGVKSEFLAGLGEAMSPIGGAYQQLQVAQARDKAAEEAARAAAATIPSVGAMPTTPIPETQTPQERGKPKQPGGRMYALSSDGKWRWMGRQKGWTKVK